MCPARYTASAKARRGKEEQYSLLHGVNPRFKQLCHDIGTILEKPSLSLSLFVIGVIFIVVASKQVRLLVDASEALGFMSEPREGVLSYLMAAIVFLMVWVDVVFYVVLRDLFLRLFTNTFRWYSKMQTAMHMISSDDSDDDIIKPKRKTPAKNKSRKR